jgi:hypothetical protein
LYGYTFECLLLLLCLLQVDLSRLPAPPQACDSVTSYVAPRSQAEQVLQGVWQEVLGLSQPPSVEADFFTELGGSSLQVHAFVLPPNCDGAYVL